MGFILAHSILQVDTLLIRRRSHSKNFYEQLLIFLYQSFITAREIRRRVHRRRGQQPGEISLQTIRNRLHFDRLTSHRLRKRPSLTDRHKRNRLAFGRRHRRWTRRQWGNVLFTDESTVSLRWVDARRRVWRRRREDIGDEGIQPVEAFGGGRLMVWAGISTDGKTDMEIIRGGLTADRYIHDILRPHVVPYADAIGNAFILMDDNATPHRAGVTNQFLADEGINRLIWPSKSPDLNPIEHLWAHLKFKVDKRIKPTTTLHQLGRILRHAWNAIPQERIRRLVHSMRRRCAAVIAADGGHTKY